MGFVVDASSRHSGEGGRTPRQGEGGREQTAAKRPGTLTDEGVAPDRAMEDAIFLMFNKRKAHQSRCPTNPTSPIIGMADLRMLPLDRDRSR